MGVMRKKERGAVESGKLSKDNIKPSWELHRLEADFSGQFGDYLLFQQLVKSSKDLE